MSLISESSTHPYKTRYAFSRSPPCQGVMSTNLLPVTAPSIELSYTHYTTSTKIGRAYKSEKSPFHNTFTRQVCDDTRLSTTLTKLQAMHTQIANHHIQRARNHFVTKCWRVSSKFRPATWKCRQVTTKRHAPLLILVATMEKCKQGNELLSWSPDH